LQTFFYLPPTNLILMEQVLDFLDSIKELEPGLRNFLKENLRRSAPQPGTVILQEGAIAQNIYFLEKGLIRAVRLGENDIEKTPYFMRENDVFISIRSFFEQIPSKETIEPLEPCICYSLTYSLLKEALKRYPSFQLHRAELLQKYYLQSEKREDMRQIANIFDRLCFLMENYPEFVNRVADKYLASFINIRPTYFSELKKKYIELQMNKR
jgi:CRP-like cAMP-binding protein